MSPRSCAAWDQAGVAEQIDSYWRHSAVENLHRDLLAELCALCFGATAGEVVEIGCGTGRIYERLVPKLVANERYTGIDGSERMLAIARQRFPQGRFLEGDGEQLGFADGAFDHALAFEVLGHLPAIAPLIRELVRVARRAAIFTIWPTPEGLDEGAEEIAGVRFLHRSYSHSYVMAQIGEALPGAAIAVELAILHAGCWAYVLRPEGPRPGPSLSRIFPVGRFNERLWSTASSGGVSAKHSAPCSVLG